MTAFTRILRSIHLLALGLVFVAPALRLVRAGENASLPPGVIVGRTSVPETQFVGSPSIAILPDGSYVASHDLFGKAGPELGATRIYQSKDRGETWTQIASFTPATWGSLFWHAGALYHMAFTGDPGSVVMRRSSDHGRTWTEPKDAESGVLFTGGYHSAPVPVVVHNGRIWRAAEEIVNDLKWPRHFEAVMLSAPADGDLLEAANWTRSSGVVFDAEWLPGRRPGWLEGNAVVTPEGNLVNMLRVNTELGPDADYAQSGPAAGIPRFEVAAMAQVSADGRTLSFDPATGFVHFPGGLTKFTIRYDERTGRYWSLVNTITHPHAEREVATEPVAQRNVVILTSSADLRNWTEHRVVLAWRPGEKHPRKVRHGFQYLDWQFDGDDLVAVSRTAWDAKSFHDANFLTFHRVKNFRADLGGAR